MDRFRDKEDEDTTLSILLSGSLGISVMEADIATLCHERISVYEKNNPAPDNVMQSDYVFPTPSSLIIDVEPQLDFRSQLVWEIFENTLFEEIDSGEVDGRQTRARRGALGDHDIVTAPKYCGNCFVDEKK